MQEIMAVKNERRQRLAEHPFYTWVSGRSVPIERKLAFAPIMANFVMNFRDMNLWFIRFEEPKNELESIINGNTLEDETHSRLFMADWKTLGLDNHLSWSAGDVLWWLFLAPDTEPFRRFGMQFSRMTVADRGDPLVRFAHSEAGEACGHIFFDHLSRVAAELSAKTSRDYVYFGEHHLVREPGHVIGSPGIFENRILNTSQRADAMALANEMFDIFFEMHDCFHRYARTYVDENRVPARAASMPREVRNADSAVPAQEQEAVHPSQEGLQSLLLERKARAARHPLYAWMQDETSLDARRKLRRFAPMWVMDIMGYRDLNRYALRYDAPASADEARLNRWSDNLQGHSPLFLEDWDALALDERLNWGARDTLEFLFLNPMTDVHRRNIAKFIKLAFGHPEPVRRFWLMEALESSGHAFFENTRRLARKAEQEHGIRLDYLGDRHDAPVSDVDGAFHGDERSLKSLPMTPEDRDVVEHMIGTVFDAVEEQLGLSLEVGASDKLGVG